ncbi:MAG: DUF2914 domain-containing protein [Patescibacteria group bacterium]
MRDTLKNLKPFFDKYERSISAAALFIGFVIDSLTLRRIDLLFENTILITYLLVAGLCIILLNLRDKDIWKHPWFAWVMTVVPFVMQIAFGALFSGFAVFYFRSASLSASWLFMLFIFGMLVGNEIFRPYYERLVFHIGVYFFAILSYCVFAVPIVLHTMNTYVFIASILASLLVVSGFIFTLSFFIRKAVEHSLPRIAQCITAIAAIVLFAYLTNIIPPVPLSLKESVIAHNAVRAGDTYSMSVEHRSLFDSFSPVKTYHRLPVEPVYVWVSVFAPTNLSTAIVHEWQQKQNGSWVTMNRVAFPIRGGRDAGFRGYSVKNNITEGEWRVSVETERGQVIGRVRFNVVDVSVRPELVSIVR